MSITAGPPFNSADEQTLAIAYISVFVFVFSVSGCDHLLFPQCPGLTF